MSCATQVYFSEKSTWMRACEFAMLRECCSLSHCSFPFLLLCYCLLSFCVALLEELGQNGNDTCIASNCWLLNHQELCTVCWFRHFAKRTMLLHSLPVKYLYTVRGSINLHNIHSASSFQQVRVALSRKKVSSHGSCKLQIHTLCGSLLLFKTEHVFRAIQHTCFCQLWVISTNY